MDIKTKNRISAIIHKEHWTPDETGKVELIAKLSDHGEKDATAMRIPYEKLILMSTAYQTDKRYLVYRYVCAWLDMWQHWARAKFLGADKIQSYFLEFARNVLMYEQAYFYFGDLPKAMDLNGFDILTNVNNDTISIHDYMIERGQDEYYGVLAYNACIDAISTNFGVDISYYRLVVSDMVEDAQREIIARFNAIRDVISKEQATDIRAEKLRIYDQVFKPFDIVAAEPDAAHIKELTSKKNFIHFYQYNTFETISKPKRETSKRIDISKYLPKRG